MSPSRLVTADDNVDVCILELHHITQGFAVQPTSAAFNLGNRQLQDIDSQDSLFQTEQCLPKFGVTKQPVHTFSFE